jgi:hypothetical protein
MADSESTNSGGETVGAGADQHEPAVKATEPKATDPYSYEGLLEKYGQPAEEVQRKFALRTGKVARVTVWTWAALSLIGALIIGLKTDTTSNAYSYGGKTFYDDATTRPYVAVAVAAALVTAMLAAIALTVVEYVIYRLMKDES